MLTSGLVPETTLVGTVMSGRLLSTSWSRLHARVASMTASMLMGGWLSFNPRIFVSMGLPSASMSVPS